MVRSTITLLNTINRRNIKSPETPLVLKDTINDSLDSWLTILGCFSKVRAGPPDEIGFFKRAFAKNPTTPRNPTLFINSPHNLVVSRNFLNQKNCLELFLSVHFLFSEFSNWIWRFPFEVYVKHKLSVHNVTSWVNFHFAQTKTLFICGEDTEISTSMERIGVTNSWRFKLSKTVPSNTRRITWDRRIPSYHIKHKALINTSGAV